MLVIDVANKTAEEWQKLMNICNKVVENQIKLQQRNMEPDIPIVLLISEEKWTPLGFSEISETQSANCCFCILTGKS